MTEQSERSRYGVRYDGENRNGVSFWVIVDTRTDRVRATWTIAWAAYEQCDWLNAHGEDARG